MTLNPTNNRVSRSVGLITGFVVYLLFLVIFYYRYIPLIKNFQLILAPICLLLLLVTSYRQHWGILLFIFVFPLFNNLPYFFNIYEKTPHAPVALVFFLFFFLGWMINQVLTRNSLEFDSALLKPMALLALITISSALISLFKYSNFFPMQADSFYELVVNVKGVTAGGAVMSVIFAALNLLSGFLFFFISANAARNEIFMKKMVTVLLLAAALSISFGMLQHFYDNNIGNTPGRAFFNTLNATYKDPNSLGAFLSVLIPISLGSFLWFKKTLKVLSVFVFVSGLFILSLTGFLSGLIGIGFSILAFVPLFLYAGLNRKKKIFLDSRKTGALAGIILTLMIVLGLIVFVSSDSKSIEKLKSRTSFSEGKIDINSLTGQRISYFWFLAVEMFKDYPATGVGIGSYIIELPNYAQLYEKELRVTDSAENYVFHISSELGIFGLFLSLWIFVVILRRIKSTLIQAPPDSLFFLKIGLSLALFSMFINFLFHTYIGSYEVKYLFWMTVGLLFSFRTQKAEKLFGGILKITALILLVLFSGIYFWKSLHSLSIESRTKELGIKQEFGFYEREKTAEGRKFRWTGLRAGYSIVIKKPVLKMAFHAAHPDIESNPVEVDVFLVKNFFRDKILLGHIVLDTNGWRNFQYSLEKELNNNAILMIKVNRTWNPSKSLGLPDSRNLGVALDGFYFRDAQKEDSDLKINTKPND